VKEVKEGVREAEALVWFSPSSVDTVLDALGGCEGQGGTIWKAIQGKIIVTIGGTTEQRLRERGWKEEVRVAELPDARHVVEALLRDKTSSGIDGNGSTVS